MYFLLHSSGLTFRAGGRKEKERSIRYRGSVRSTLARRDIVIIFWRDTTRGKWRVTMFRFIVPWPVVNFYFHSFVFIEIEEVRTYVTRIPHVHPYRDFILVRILLEFVESLRWDRVTGPPLRLNEFNEFFSVDRSVIGDLVEFPPIRYFYRRINSYWFAVAEHAKKREGEGGKNPRVFSPHESMTLTSVFEIYIRGTDRKRRPLVFVTHLRKQRSWLANLTNKMAKALKFARWSKEHGDRALRNSRGRWISRVSE